MRYTFYINNPLKVAQFSLNSPQKLFVLSFYIHINEALICQLSFLYRMPFVVCIANNFDTHNNWSFYLFINQIMENRNNQVLWTDMELLFWYK